MHKLLPFRQYDEKDVINLFSLDVSNQKSAEYVGLKAGSNGWNSGGNFSGVGVKASAGSLGGDEPTLGEDSYLGAIGGADQAHALSAGNQYNYTNGSVTLNAASATLLGITLRATLAYDENMEKLLYYARKLDELQAVLPGQAVPVATRGVFTGTVGTGECITTGIGGIAIGNGLIGAANGAFTAATAAASGNVGTVLAKGQNGGKDVALFTLGRV